MLSDQDKIEILAHGYRDSSKILHNYELGLKSYQESQLKVCRTMIAHIEDAVNFLDEREKFIIYNEVILGKKGKWYLEYYSPSAFNVRKKQAYKEFLRILEL